MTDKPALISELEAVFGSASSSAFGSTVFFETQSTSGYKLALVDASMEKYRYFCGEAWGKFGEEKWMSGWGELFQRSQADKAGIVKELRSIRALPFRSCAAMFLDEYENNEAVHQLLATAFDSVQVSELRVFSLGDGESMAGFLIAAEVVDLGRLFLAFLMD